jgi:DNA gyrase subunit A
MLTRRGYIKKTALSAFANVRSNGLIAISLEEGDELCWVRRARPADDVVMATRQGMGIRFRADDEQLRPLGAASSRCAGHYPQRRRRHRQHGYSLCRGGEGC